MTTSSQMNITVANLLLTSLLTGNLMTSANLYNKGSYKMVNTQIYKSLYSALNMKINSFNNLQVVDCRFQEFLSTPIKVDQDESDIKINDRVYTSDFPIYYDDENIEKIQIIGCTFYKCEIVDGKSTAGAIMLQLVTSGINEPSRSLNINDCIFYRCSSKACGCININDIEWNNWHITISGAKFSNCYAYHEPPTMNSNNAFLTLDDTRAANIYGFRTTENVTLEYITMEYSGSNYDVFSDPEMTFYSNRNTIQYINSTKKLNDCSNVLDIFYISKDSNLQFFNIYDHRGTTMLFLVLEYKTSSEGESFPYGFKINSFNFVNCTIDPSKNDVFYDFYGASVISFCNNKVSKSSSRNIDISIDNIYLIDCNIPNEFPKRFLWHEARIASDIGTLDRLEYFIANCTNCYSNNKDLISGISSTENPTSLSTGDWPMHPLEYPTGYTFDTNPAEQGRSETNSITETNSIASNSKDGGNNKTLIIAILVPIVVILIIVIVVFFVLHRNKSKPTESTSSSNENGNIDSMTVETKIQTDVNPLTTFTTDNPFATQSSMLPTNDHGFSSDPFRHDDDGDDNDDNEF